MIRIFCRLLIPTYLRHPSFAHKLPEAAQPPRWPTNNLKVLTLLLNLYAFQALLGWSFPVLTLHSNFLPPLLPSLYQLLTLAPRLSLCSVPPSPALGVAGLAHQDSALLSPHLPMPNPLAAKVHQLPRLQGLLCRLYT